MPENIWYFANHEKGQGKGNSEIKWKEYNECAHVKKYYVRNINGKVNEWGKKDCFGHETIIGMLLLSDF